MRLVPGPRRSGPTALLLALLGTLAVAAAPSSAAPYSVWSCQGPNGEPLDGDAWVASTTGTGAGASNDCSSGMRAGLPAGRASSRGAGTLNLTAPAGARIVAFDISRTLRASVGGLFSTGYVANVSSIDPTGPLGAGCSGGGLTLPSTCTVGDPPLAATGVSIQGVAVTAGCAQDSCPSATPTAEATVARSLVTIDDPQAPQVAGISGDLKDSGKVARSITVAATDVGGGISSISANVDGGATVVSPTGGTCAAPYTSTQPCPTGRQATFGIDTAPLRRGDHVATGTIVDAAGTTTAWGPVPFVVPSDGTSDGGPAPAGSIPVPVSPATTPDGAPMPSARLTFQGTTNRSGRRVPTGYLRTQGGAPLSGVLVRLTRTQTGVENPRTVALRPVRTAKNGRFVGAPLPEGAWTVAGAANVSSGTIAASIRLRTGLRITAVPSTRRLRTGGRIVLAGRLRGAGPAKAGVRVQIQTIIRGRYTRIATVRTTRSGRWEWRYRFTKVSRPTLFAFRAVVPGEGATWPWASASRRAATVRVDPR